MSNKDDILKRYRANVREKYEMPDLSDIKATTYADPLVQFIKMFEAVGGRAIEVTSGRDVNSLIRELFPEAKEIASNVPGISIATRNPDTVKSACDLNGTDVGVVCGIQMQAFSATPNCPRMMPTSVPFRSRARPTVSGFLVAIVTSGRLEAISFASG